MHTLLYVCCIENEDAVEVVDGTFTWSGDNNGGGGNDVGAGGDGGVDGASGVGVGERRGETLSE